MSLQYVLELLGTMFFAISGAMAIRSKHDDLFGASFTGFVTAIGGGSLRDMILGSYPLVWVGDIYFIYAIIVGVIIAFFFSTMLSKLPRTFIVFDTLGIGFFTILGVEKALSLGARPEVAAIMGMFTAIMGGVIRDTLTNEVPVIFRKEIYATACLAGAVLYLTLNRFGVESNVNLIISILLVIVLRWLSIKYKLSLPSFRR